MMLENCGRAIWQRAIGSGLVAIAIAAAAFSARAEEIAVTNYGGGPPGYPITIALENGYFKEAGVNITGVQATAGGSEAVRLLLAGDLAYAETVIGPFMAAIQRGADLKMVSENFNNSSANAWVVLPTSSIQSVNDLKGKTIGYTSPQSTSQGNAYSILKKLGLKETDVKLVTTGGFGPALTLLEHGGVDMTVVTEPQTTMTRGKYRVIISGHDSSFFPPFNNGVGFVSTRYAREHADTIRAIIAARRKGVEFMIDHRPEAAAILAKAYKLDPTVMKGVLDNLIGDMDVGGVPNFSKGDFHFKSEVEALAMAKQLGVLQGDPDLKAAIDQSYLPKDLVTELK